MDRSKFTVIDAVMSDDAHARLGCSNVRWEHCPGSIREEAQYENVSGAAAIDGTGSHLLLELLLIQWRETNERPYAIEYEGRIIGDGDDEHPDGWDVKRDRCERVEIMLCYIERRMAELNINIQSVTPEERTNPGRFFGRTDWWGTADVTIRGADMLEIADYKDGRMYVSEKENTQLSDYGFGQVMEELLENPDRYKTVRLTIVQPKTTPPIRYENISVDDLIERMIKKSERAFATDAVDAPLIPGAHCNKFCSHKSDCMALNSVGTQGVELMLQNTNGGSILESISKNKLAPSEMTAEQLAEIHNASAAISTLLKNVADEMFKRVSDSPNAISGFAIGTGRGSNVWSNDEETTARMLKSMRVKKEDMYKTSMISPAAALKLEGLSPRQVTKMTEEMITHVKGKPALVKSEQEVKSAEEVFAKVINKPLSFL